MTKKYKKSDLKGVGKEIYRISPSININKFLNWVNTAFPETFKFLILIHSVHKDPVATSAILVGLIEEFDKLQL